MRDATDERQCRFCKGGMSFVDLPDYGRVWQCPVCIKGLVSDDGSMFDWRRPAARARRRDYEEQKRRSQKPCPECGEMMWEVIMPDFGSRWQCESCRLTVFSSGGIQRWKSAPKTSTQETG